MAQSPEQLLADLERRFKSVAVRMPVAAGNVVVNFALDNFKRQGFLGATFQPWKPRKATTKWGKKSGRQGRSILVDTGKLRRATRIVKADWDSVVIGNDMPYAKAHNEGLRMGLIQQVSAHTRKVTKVGIVKTVGRKNKTNITYGRVATGNLQQVRAHTRRIDQRIPARPFLADSPYLQKQLQREMGGMILKALKQ